MKFEINMSNKQLIGFVIILFVVSSISFVYSQAPNPGHSWDDIGDIPAGFSDSVDNDMLAGISCAEGQTLKVSGGNWVCGYDYGDNLGDHVATQDLDMNNNRITSAAAPISGGDVVTKDYADLNYKDPPGEWTCNIRSQRGGTGLTTVFCVGNEKVITGGCRMSQGSGEYLFGYPTTNGWNCYCPGPSGVCGTVYAYAYCCV